MAEGTNTFEATDQDFQQSVIDRSHQVPVLVDFWAPWCGPCRTLGPTLEKLAEQYGGRFMLAKVNVDENMGIAQAVRIQSIPAVKLVAEGRIKDEFVGALPEPQVREFLDRNLPSGEDLSAADALSLMQAGQTEQAVQTLQQVLAEDPDNAVALVGMGLYAAEQGELDKAQELADQVNEVALERVTDRQHVEKALAGLRARLFLKRNAQGNGSANGNAELAQRFTEACQQALEGQVEPALDTFLDIVRTDRAFQEDAGRKAMLAVFDLLPPDSAVTSQYRNRLSNLLFA